VATPVMDNSVQMPVRILRKDIGGYCRGNIHSVAQALEHCQCKLLHRKRSTVRYGNALFSYLQWTHMTRMENMLIPKL